MPKWIHDRAQHLQAKNPSMPESQAWAIATQQAHALGKSPKSYGTHEARAKAKEKYKTPGDDKKTANPGNLKNEKTAMDEIMMAAFHDELEKIAEARKNAGAFDRFMGGAAGKVSLPQRTMAPDVAKRAVVPRSAGGFQPAVVGYGGTGPAPKKPLPAGPLNPGGGML